MAKRKKTRPDVARPSTAISTRRPSVQITPRPELRRQIDARDLLVFWRDASTGRRTGLALTINSCEKVACACRVVTLDGLVITDDVTQIEFARDVLTVTHLPDAAPLETKRKIYVEVDIETGEVDPLKEDFDRDLLYWVTSELDGELLDRLHERWRLGKGWTGRSRIRREMDLRGWEAGELLGFDEVFEAERLDRYVIGEQGYWADTFLCPVPGCDCGDADVMFSSVGTEMSGDVGCVRVVLRGAAAEVVELRSEPGQGALLGDLWERYLHRHDVGTYLVQRQTRMRMAWGAIERALATTAAAATTTGSAVTDRAPLTASTATARPSGDRAILTG